MSCGCYCHIVARRFCWINKKDSCAYSSPHMRAEQSRAEQSRAEQQQQSRQRLTGVANCAQPPFVKHDLLQHCLLPTTSNSIISPIWMIALCLQGPSRSDVGNDTSCSRPLVNVFYHDCLTCVRQAIILQKLTLECQQTLIGSCQAY